MSINIDEEYFRDVKFLFRNEFLRVIRKSKLLKFIENYSRGLSFVVVDGLTAQNEIIVEETKESIF